MFCVGLTGNIASGKSTALEYFAKQGAYTISADRIARELATQPLIIDKIKNYFGESVVNSAGELLRPTIRKIIAQDARKRLWLEDLLHPLIQHEICARVSQSKSQYSVIEIPLLLNKQTYPFINRILLITAPVKQQIQRVIARDHCNINEAKAILKIQPTLNVRKKIADDIIYNDRDTCDFVKQLEILHKNYLQFSATSNSLY